MTYHIVGDGLAGLVLARRLLDEGNDVVLYGDGQTNTPPVGLVHLFAGRSFRRSELELETFAEAVRFWRNESLAQEFSVQRKLSPGDRLDRSLEEAELPQEWTPTRLNAGWVEYSPGFSVAAQALERRLREELMSSYHQGLRDWRELPGVRILALGQRAPTLGPEFPWDLSQGRTVEALSDSMLEVLVIGGGVHRAPYPGGRTVILGGRSSPLGPPPEDELEIAVELTGAPHQELSTWSGHRCAAPDHRPILGWLDPRTFVFLGFGSRALFWLPYCVKATRESLKGAETHPELDWSRFNGKL